MEDKSLGAALTGPGSTPCGPSPSDFARFMAKIRKDQSGCWLWNAAKDADGYGVFYLHGKNPRAHRASLALHGVDIPPGTVVDHICRNRSCVNPSHLRPVDRLTNVHENSSAPAHLNSLKTHCLRGHALAGENLWTRRDGRRYCRACHALRQRETYRLRKASSAQIGG